MAKKVVATLQSKSKEYAKVISMEKSSKTGAYMFKETMVPSDKVQEALSSK
jgi:hypothetical protein